MASLVNRSRQSVFVGHGQLLSLDAHHDAVTRVLEVTHARHVLHTVHCLRDCSVHQVLYFGACEARSQLRKLLGFHVRPFADLV